MKTYIAAIFLLSLLSAAVAAPPTFGSCTIFPPDDEWNRPIDTDAVDPLSECLVKTIGGFGPAGPFGSAPIRLDYSMGWNRVDQPPALRPLGYGNGGESYQDESDWLDSNGNFQNGNTLVAQWANPPMFRALTPAEGVKIEGGVGATSGDRHMLTVVTSTCMLYETYATSWNPSTGGYQVAGSAIWNLSRTIPQRPERWSSCDAAGLPIYPGVLKLEELQAGAINHALRFTALRAQRAYTFPASHLGSWTNYTYPHYGARFRLKASFDVSRYSAETRVLLTALKTYGIIFADQGTTAFITADDNVFPASINSEINQGTRKIEFNTTNFELVQSRGAIFRDYAAGNVRCTNGVWGSGAPTALSPAPVPSTSPNPSPSPSPAPVPAGSAPSNRATVTPSNDAIGPKFVCTLLVLGSSAALLFLM